MNGETDGIRFSCCQGRRRAGDTRHYAQGQLVTAVLGDGEAETSADPDLKPRPRNQTLDSKCNSSPKIHSPRSLPQTLNPAKASKSIPQPQVPSPGPKSRP